MILDVFGHERIIDTILIIYFLISSRIYKYSIIRALSRINYYMYNKLYARTNVISSWTSFVIAYTEIIYVFKS